MNEERGRTLIRISTRSGHTTIDFSEDSRKYLKDDEFCYLYHLTDKIEYRIRRKMFMEEQEHERSA